MTTSKTPWTSKLRDRATILSDALGNEVGVINDGQNADMILELLNSAESLSELRSTVDRLEGEVEEYEEESKEQSEEIERLEKEIEVFKAKEPAA